MILLLSFHTKGKRKEKKKASDKTVPLQEQKLQITYIRTDMFQIAIKAYGRGVASLVLKRPLFPGRLRTHPYSLIVYCLYISNL